MEGKRTELRELRWPLVRAQEQRVAAFASPRVQQALREDLRDLAHRSG